MPEMYDGQLELEYACVCCHKNTYPRRLVGGYCTDCIIGGMTAEELVAEAREHEAWQEDYCARHLYDYARDVVNGRHTVEQAALRCYASLSEMEEAVEEVREQWERDERSWREAYGGMSLPPLSVPHIEVVLPAAWGASLERAASAINAYALIARQAAIAMDEFNALMRVMTARRSHAFVHRALARGAAHKRKQAARREDDRMTRIALQAIGGTEEEFRTALDAFFAHMGR